MKKNLIIEAAKNISMNFKKLMGDLKNAIISAGKWVCSKAASGLEKIFNLDNLVYVCALVWAANMLADAAMGNWISFTFSSFIFGVCLTQIFRIRKLNGVYKKMNKVTKKEADKIIDKMYSKVIEADFREVEPQLATTTM